MDSRVTKQRQSKLRIAYENAQKHKKVQDQYQTVAIPISENSKPKPQAKSYGKSLLLIFGIVCIVSLTIVLSLHLADLEDHHSGKKLNVDATLAPMGSVDVVGVASFGPIALTTKSQSLGAYHSYSLELEEMGFDLSNVRNYDICCVSKTHRLVCNGGVLFPGADVIDGYLRNIGDEYELYLYVSSQDLVAVECRLSGLVQV